MSDQGPFIMSRYASSDHLHEAMRKRIAELESMLRLKQDDWMDECKRIDELEKENERLREAVRGALGWFALNSDDDDPSVWPAYVRKCESALSAKESK